MDAQWNAWWMRPGSYQCQTNAEDESTRSEPALHPLTIILLNYNQYMHTQTMPAGPAGSENEIVDAIEGIRPMILNATAKICTDEYARRNSCLYPIFAIPYQPLSLFLCLPRPAFHSPRSSISSASARLASSAPVLAATAAWVSVTVGILASMAR